jgi:Tfp pilus assembly protein PilN
MRSGDRMKSTINLISEILEEQRFPMEKLLLPAVLLLPLMILLMASVWQVLSARAMSEQVKRVTERRDALTAEIVRLTQEIMSLQSGDAQQQDDQKKAMTVKALLKGRVLWSDVFREVSFVVPPGVWLRSIETFEPGSPVVGGKPSGAQQTQTVESKQVKFIGFAKSNLAMTQFIAALERSEHFTEILLVYAQRGTEPDSQQVSFEIGANLRTMQL